jgi:hypothetical protein
VITTYEIAKVLVLFMETGDKAEVKYVTANMGKNRAQA